MKNKILLRPFQFFGGKFYKCVDESGDRLPVEVVDNKFECKMKNYSWVNSKITFDHVGHAYLALFQVSMADILACLLDLSLAE